MILGWSRNADASSPGSISRSASPWCEDCHALNSVSWQDLQDSEPPYCAKTVLSGTSMLLDSAGAGEGVVLVTFDRKAIKTARATTAPTGKRKRIRVCFAGFLLRGGGIVGEVHS